jgi:hypothetical protein
VITHSLTALVRNICGRLGRSVETISHGRKPEPCMTFSRKIQLWAFSVLVAGAAELASPQKAAAQAMICSGDFVMQCPDDPEGYCAPNCQYDGCYFIGSGEPGYPYWVACAPL